MSRERHIDEVQPATVSEHLQLLIDDREEIAAEIKKLTVSDLPEWFDAGLFRRGQKFYMDNMFAFGTIHLTGLLSILCVPDIAEVLVFTKKSSTILLSYKRYVQTLLYMYDMFRSDILDPESRWMKAINAVRAKHASASRMRVKQKLHGIYQKDMVITQFGFLGYTFLCPEKVGVAHATTEEMDGYRHFWRVVGHLLGIPDRMNICRQNVAETQELCRRINDEILVKHLNDPQPNFLQLSHNAVNSLWYFDPTINQDAFMYFMYNLSGTKYNKPLGWYAQFDVARRQLTLQLCSAPYVGWIVRMLHNKFVASLRWLLEYYPIAAWLAFGKEQTKICMYSST